MLGIGIAVAVVLTLAIIGALVARQSPPGTSRSAPPAFAPGPAEPENAPRPGETLIRSNVWVEWDSAKAGGSNTFAVDGLTIQASSLKAKDGETPILNITAPSGVKVVLRGATDGIAESASMRFGVGKFDTSSPLPQVVMTSYSGGAHCCLNIRVADFHNGTWKALTVYNADGDEIDFPKDVDGDGTLDFVLTDDRFNYEFASHAGSWTPPLVLDIVEGRVLDVSNQSRYRSLYEADFSRTEGPCKTGAFVEDGKTYPTEINGACAAYVADGARLGRVGEAWSVMLAHYDHSNGGGGDPNAGFLPTKCFVPLVNYQCPAGQEHKFATYPDALRWFLGDNGYLPPVKITPN